ncbi:MAG: PaaI family thioesterase, partial [Prolixibacteraceae bacterium]|nr:PaaI family thioesterase [Prolixibacteraceae bacterium]
VMRPEGNVLDGGLILSMIESVAGIGSMTLLDNDKYEVRGMQVNVNHVRGLTKGRAIAVADIIHKGRLTHIWNVNVKSEENKLISTGRVVNIVLSKK